MALTANSPNKTQDPDDDLDYEINWQGDKKPFLAVGETITTSTWSADDDLTLHDDTHTDTTTTVWVSGGDTGQTYVVTNHIVTSEGREKDGSLYITIKEQ